MATSWLCLADYFFLAKLQSSVTSLPNGLKVHLKSGSYKKNGKHDFQHAFIRLRFFFLTNATQLICLSFFRECDLYHTDLTNKVTTYQASSFSCNHLQLSSNEPINIFCPQITGCHLWQCFFMLQFCSPWCSSPISHLFITIATKKNSKLKQWTDESEYLGYSCL